MTGLTIKKTPETARQQMPGWVRTKIPSLVLWAHRLNAFVHDFGGRVNSKLTDF